MSNKMIVIAGAMALAAFSFAQDAPFGPAQGAKTIAASGSYSSTSGPGDDLKVARLSLLGSYFFTNAIEGILGVDYLNVDAGGGSDSSDSIHFGGRYYFSANRELSMEQPWSPFAGLFFTTSKASGLDRENGFGVELGAQYFLQPNVSLTPTLSWSRTSIDSDDFDTVALGFGLTIWFK